MVRKVLVPSGLLPKTDVKKLQPKDRDSYANNLILEVLSKNPSGVTIKQIVDYTHLARNTVTKHIERLVAIRAATKKEFGYVSIYFAGGKSDESSETSLNCGSTSYFFQMVDRGLEGKYVYIQERQLDEFSVPKVSGGILVPATYSQQFIKKLHSFASKEIGNDK